MVVRVQQYPSRLRPNYVASPELTIFIMVPFDLMRRECARIAIDILIREAFASCTRTPVVRRPVETISQVRNHEIIACRCSKWPGPFPKRRETETGIRDSRRAGEFMETPRGRIHVHVFRERRRTAPLESQMRQNQISFHFRSFAPVRALFSDIFFSFATRQNRRQLDSVDVPFLFLFHRRSQPVLRSSRVISLKSRRFFHREGT